MMDSMNTWLQDKRRTFATARGSSAGDVAAGSQQRPQQKRQQQQQQQHQKISSSSSSSSRNRSSITTNTTKRKGRRPGTVPRPPQVRQTKREAEEKRLNRIQLQNNDDSDYNDSESDLSNRFNSPAGTTPTTNDDSFSYDEEEVVDDSSDDGSNDGSSSSDGDPNTANDGDSVYTTITVETTRTKENENRKPLGPFSGYFGGSSKPTGTQVFVNANDPVRDLINARNDITKLSIFCKSVHFDQDVAQNFLALVRGDNRSWEAIAVDILRQKARWESIVLEECTSGDDTDHIQVDGNEEYLDLTIAHVLAVDNCAYLHLSNFLWSGHTAWSMQALMFTKSLTKLQLDLIDLTFAIPMLARGLKSNTSLKCLIASRCGLQDGPLGELLGNLPLQLEELRIFGNRCRAKGLAAVTNIVMDKTAQLKLLDLSYQHVADDEEFDIQWLAAAVRNNTKLKTLDLDNDSIDDGHLTHIIAALTKNKTLEELMLNHNKITGTGVAMLASKFGEMKGLKKISMYSNVFDAETTPTSASPAAAAAAAASSSSTGKNASPKSTRP
jgi:hypothetical protein